MKVKGVELACSGYSNGICCDNVVFGTAGLYFCSEYHAYLYARDHQLDWLMKHVKSMLEVKDKKQQQEIKEALQTLRFYGFLTEKSEQAFWMARRCEIT